MSNNNKKKNDKSDTLPTNDATIRIGNSKSSNRLEDYLVPLQVPCVYHDAFFLSGEWAMDCYHQLKQSVPWKTSAKLNRWVCLMTTMNDNDIDGTTTTNNNNPQSYTYRDAPDAPIAFSQTVLQIKRAAEEWYNSKQQQQQQNNDNHNTNINTDTNNNNNTDTATTTTTTKVTFNVCLLNFYEHGQQRIGWHSDREELGRTTPIASVSLGASRSFLLRSTKAGARHDRASLSLTNGSLVVMEPSCQLHYLHTVPHEPDISDGRINLTFRAKVDTTPGEGLHARRDTTVSEIVQHATPTTNSWKAVPAVAAEPQSSSSSSSNRMVGGSTAVFGDTVRTNTLDDDDKQPQHWSIQYICSTNLGAECYLAAELEERLNSTDDDWWIVARPHGLDGFVGICRRKEKNDDQSTTITTTIETILLQLQSAHHVLLYHTHFHLSELVNDDFPTPESIDGETLYQYVKQRLENGTLSISTLQQPSNNDNDDDNNTTATTTFRVSCERIGGPHSFRSPEVEFEIGGALSEYYSHVRPQMSDYDVHVRVFVVGTGVVVMGTQLNVVDLSRNRHFLKFRNAVTIKTNLAYAMVRCAAIQEGDCIADCFCGSGTILLEALDVYNKKLSCIGLDVSRRSVQGAEQNALAENFTPEMCRFVCSDARNLRRHLQDNSLDAMVTNLPWGVQTGQNTDLPTMYEIFLRTAWYTLKDNARIVMLVLRGLQLTRIIRKLSGRYKILSVNVVRTTNNLPCIVVIQKLGVDELNESLKGQLAHLNQFVSVSPEIYHAIHAEQVE